LEALERKEEDGEHHGVAGSNVGEENEQASSQGMGTPRRIRMRAHGKRATDQHLDRHPHAIQLPRHVACYRKNRTSPDRSLDGAHRPNPQPESRVRASFVPALGTYP
jgi:hypothetical protein